MARQDGELIKKDSLALYIIGFPQYLNLHGLPANPKFNIAEQSRPYFTRLVAAIHIHTYRSSRTFFRRSSGCCRCLLCSRCCLTTPFAVTIGTKLKVAATGITTLIFVLSYFSTVATIAYVTTTNVPCTRNTVIAAPTKISDGIGYLVELFK